MDVHLSDEQILLRESARDFLAAECPMEHVRASMEAAPGSPDALWKKMAELGWTGLTLPEVYGGTELELLSLSLLCQEMGRVLLPSPYLSTVAVGAQAVLLGGSDALKQRVLPGIADGSSRIALALLEDDSCWSPESVSLSAKASADGFTLD